jgi:hypothetical protein
LPTRVKEDQPMQFIAPDILAEGRGLSLSLSALGFLAGLLLWITGWRGHRFWIVLLTTLAGGLVGLRNGAVYRVQPVVAGILLAVAAGMLALALVRVVAFAAGGLTFWLAVRVIGPPSWQEPFICFLSGGLLGLLLFRLWTMVLTSFGGTLLMGYSGLWFLDRLGKVDAVALANYQQHLLNWLCGGFCLGGFVVQFLIERWKLNQDRHREEQERQQSEKILKKLYDQQRWWHFGRRPPFRKAG